MGVIAPWGPVEQLVLAVGGRDEQVRAAADQIGLPAVMEVVREELLLRCAAPPMDGKATVQLEVAHGEERAGIVFTFTDGSVEAEHGWLDGEQPTVRYTIEDLLRGLFGSGRTTMPSRNVVLCMPENTSFTGGFDWALRQIRPTSAIVAAVSDRHTDLGRLSMAHGSDKWGGWHFYTSHYERYFAALRDEPVRVLEIGIGGYNDPNLGGASLRMWRDFFRRGLIIGLDVYPKPGVHGPRIRTVEGDQTDRELMARLGTQAGPFDIVVDDGSHLSSDVITTFGVLYPHVRPGGFYVIEDLQTSYWPEFGGSATEFTSPHTTVGFLKTLVDGLHHPEIDMPDREPGYTDLNISGLYFHRNLVFIEKGRNTAEGLPVMRFPPRGEN